MSHTRDLLAGLRDELVAAGVTTPIFYKELPTTPDRVIALTAYSSADEATVALSHIRVQFWFRGIADKSLDVDDLADDVFDVLHGLANRTYAGVHLVQCFRISSVPLGVDGNKRSQRSDNYEIDVDFPTSAARPF